MIDVEYILDVLSEHNLIKLGRRVGSYMQLTCPFHADGNERRPSCGVLMHDEYRNGRLYPAGFTHCFTCHYAHKIEDMISDLLRINNVPKSGVDWLSEYIPGFQIEDSDDVLISDDVLDAVTATFAVDQLQRMCNTKHEYVSDEELASYRYTVPYMYERKLTDDIIEMFDVGYDPNWIPSGKKTPIPCITFPVRDVSGRTLFLCRRSIKGKIYNYPKGVSKPLYGVDMIPNGCKSIIVCESIINALTCWTWGYPAVALLGTGNVQQIQQLKELGVHEINLCLDGDDAGRSASEKIRNQLKRVCVVWTIRVPDGKDVNDLDKATFDELYRNRE